MTLALDAPDTHEATLREVIEHLASLDRPAGSEGEREAAEWLAARLRGAGAGVSVDAVGYREGYAHLLAGLCAAGTVGGVLALTARGRRAGGLLGALAGGLVADDISNGPRLVRRTVSPERTTWNVVADAGDPSADRTLVVMAHHDSARTGKVFDQRGSAAPGWGSRLWPRRPSWTSRAAPSCPGPTTTSAAWPCWWPWPRRWRAARSRD
jgi:acetylornithine deacetylase/succinyl-diaminopimelate desuccinylase-like protein